MRWWPQVWSKMGFKSYFCTQSYRSQILWQQKIFDGLGPLSQFSAKIEVAYIFRLLDEATYKDLLAIKEIRNRFAHTSQFVNFKSEEIKAACQRLSGWHKDSDNRNLYWEKTKECVDKMNEKINALVYANTLKDEPNREARRKG